MSYVDRPARFNGFFWDCPYQKEIEEQIKLCRHSLQSIVWKRCMHLRDDMTCSNIDAHNPINDKD